MVKYLFSLVLFLFCLSAVTLQAQTKADDIVGLWLPGHGRGRIQIYKKDNKFYGRIVWLKEPNNAEGKPKVDKNNPDETKRNAPLLGHVILKDFEFTGEAWEKGTIYDPDNGNTYDCIIKLADLNTLDVRGYIGVSLFGRTDTWKRLQKK